MKRLHAYIILFLFLSSASFSQEMPIPVDVQYQLFRKILGFDRNLRARCGDTLVIGIVYQKRFRTSFNTKEEFLQVFEEQSDSKIENIPSVCLPFEIVMLNELENILTKNNIDVLYIAPLRGIEIEGISSVCQKNKVLTFTGVPGYVGSGIVIGIDMKGDKPQILINLLSAKASDIDFNSQLLKLSKIIE